MKNFILQIIVFCLSTLICSQLFAFQTGVGQVAQNLMEPVTLFSNALQTVCFIIGGAFLFAALIKYFEHRRNPLMTPIGTVVFLVIAGILLILIPFLSLYTDSGVQYSLMK